MKAISEAKGETDFFKDKVKELEDQIKNLKSAN